MGRIKTMLNKKVLFTGGMTVLGLGILVLLPVLIKVLWGWVIPDLFPGAVELGFIAATMSWKTAFKLWVVVLVINIFSSK